MKNKFINIGIKIGAGLLSALVLVSSVSLDAYADRTSEATTTYSESGTTGDGTSYSSSVTVTSTINDDDRGEADEALLNYANSMMIRYTMDAAQNKKLGDLFNSAVYYIAYTDMTKSELDAYVASIQAQMLSIASTPSTSTTPEYLRVADNWKTPEANYGQRVTVVLPIINIGTEELRNLVIEPQVTTEVTTWPFVPDSTGYIQTEPYIPGYINDEQAFANRREFTYTFTVREDVMTGYYPIKFKISYTRGGERVEDDKAAELTVYVHANGKPESGYIGGNGKEENTSKSRIIVTGYEIDTDKIFSGDTFKLTIHVQNTSSDTAVTNVLFNLTSPTESTSSGGNTSESVTPFIPTSGSNSIYMERIAPKATADINIEMSAKAGLSQKSYVVELAMTYDSGLQFDLTDKANISIPVYQESKFDTSNPEVSPATIDVGSQSNVMFSIYNTGKTTLYNVQVQFSADSIESNMAFVGNLASGSTGNVDVMLTGQSATMDEGTINVAISYEDESGNETVVDKQVTLMVFDPVYDMGEYDDMGMGFEEEPKQGNTALKTIIIIAVLALAAAGIIFLIRRKKKKQEEAMAEEDIKDLEALEAPDNNEDKEA